MKIVSLFLCFFCCNQYIYPGSIFGLKSFIDEKRREMIDEESSHRMFHVKFDMLSASLSLNQKKRYVADMAEISCLKFEMLENQLLMFSGNRNENNELLYQLVLDQRNLAYRKMVDDTKLLSRILIDTEI